MNRDQRIFALLLVGPVLALCATPGAIAQTRRFRDNQEARRYTRDLPPIDKVELLKLKPSEVWNGVNPAS